VPVQATVGTGPVHVQVLPAHPPAGGLDAEEPAVVHATILPWMTGASPSLTTACSLTCRSEKARPKPTCRLASAISKPSVYQVSPRQFSRGQADDVDLFAGRLLTARFASQAARGASSRAAFVWSYPALIRREIASGDQSDPLSSAGLFMSIMGICRTRA
jgi:hypothetical protein